jgi:hypothetical protein
MLSVILLNVIMLIVTYNHYAECRYAECRYAECHGVHEMTNFLQQTNNLRLLITFNVTN